jgi:hypothetical protein
MKYLKNQLCFSILACALSAAVSLSNFQCAPCDVPCSTADSVVQVPRLSPDYTGIVVPPNIAPLNFRIREQGASFFVRIFSTRGDTISIADRKGVIRIPQKEWSRLLAANRGQPLVFSVFKRDAGAPGKWVRFAPVQNRIANEEIDRYLVYRLIDPLFRLWDEMGIYQRDLHSFTETPVLENRALLNRSPEKFNAPVTRSCVNCHTFFNRSGDTMIVHTRGGAGTGMLLVENGSIKKIDTRTPFNATPGAYAAWHPSGTLLAMTVMSVHQFFHAVGRLRDVIDTRSDIILYDVTTNTVKTFPAIAGRGAMETYPEWSPDGKYLYFCSAPQIDSSFTIYDSGRAYAKIKYSLMRVSYDIGRNAWGETETVLSSGETGLSIAHPKISPDGRFLLFCMANYGNFPIHAPESDLYLMDLGSRRYWRLSINSPFTESYHSWSSNGRWFVFSSKRDSSTCSRPYFSYIDKDGTVCKPFVLPQKDPDYYASFFKTYNVPELVNKPVRIRWRGLAEAAEGKNGTRKAALDAKVIPDGSTRATEIQNSGSR